MAIDTSTTFDKVRLYALDSTDGPDEIVRIEVRSGGNFVEKLRPREGTHRYGWDTDSTEFGIVRDAVAEGNATFEYYDRQRQVHQAADLPQRLKWMEEANVVKNEVDREQGIDDSDRPPSSLVVYKAAVNAPTEDPPCWDTTNNTWDKWRAAIEDAGFMVFDKPTPAAGEVVWEIKATYARSGGVYECVYDEWDTDGTLYSIDNGATFTTDRPANNQSGNSSINYIRRYNSELGEWEDTPFSPDFQGTSSGTGTSLSHRSFGELTVGNKYIQASSYLPRYFLARGLQNGQTVKVGVGLDYREEWNGPILLRGYCEIPDDMIPLVAPHEIEDDSLPMPVAGKTFLFVMDNVGRMNWGLIRNADRITNYYGDYHRFTGLFRSNALGTLLKSINATETVLRLSVKPRGIAQGTVLYLKRDGHTESVVVTATPSFSPFVASQAEGGYEYWAVNVNRGGRDGATSWAVNSKWYADFIGGQRHSHFVIFDKRNIHAASEIRLYQVLDQ